MKTIDINLLGEEIKLKFPSSARYFLAKGKEQVSPDGRYICFAIAQHAWTDESWSWVDDGVFQNPKNTCDQSFVPCSQGGLLHHESHSIGD